jgi:hypothetical protein
MVLFVIISGSVATCVLGNVFLDNLQQIGLIKNFNNENVDGAYGIRNYLFLSW